jgi:peptidoglycan/xylan/chitin deacetylase (PgdA/CDA1 family)
MGVHIECFHRVIPDDDAATEWPYIQRGTALTVSQFCERLVWLSERYSLIDETSVDQRGGQGSEPAACWVTFDDGYRDNLSIAAPILREFGVRPTLFLTTRVLEPGWALPVDRWYAVLRAARQPVAASPPSLTRSVNCAAKRRFVVAPKAEQEVLLSSLARQLGVGEAESPPDYLGVRDLKRLSELGWFVGPHGHEHQLLPTLSRIEAEQEVLRSIEVVQGLDVRPSAWFAFADGAFDDRVTEMTRDVLKPRGFVGAVSVAGERATQGDSAWTLPRCIARPVDDE